MVVGSYSTCTTVSIKVCGSVVLRWKWSFEVELQF